jgi:hypothetical protein
LGRPCQSAAPHRVWEPILGSEHPLKLPHRLVRRWNEQGLDLIAEGLIRDSVAVF